MIITGLRSRRLAALGATAFLAAALPTQADILVTNLTTGAALYDGANVTAGGFTPAAALASGHTFNLEFTPTAADLSGTVVLLEIGGTANGTGIYLIDGVPTYVTKHNSGDQWTPDSLFDTLVRPNGTTRGEAAVTNSFGALVDGVTYSLAVSWNQASNLVFAVQNSTTGRLDTITLHGFFNNWAGDRSFSVATNPRLLSPQGSVGGMAGESALNEFGAPWDVEDDSNLQLLKSFTGTMTRALYWNAVGGITLFPTTVATDLVWSNPGLGDYGNVANWNLGRVPRTNEIGFIRNGGTANVNDGLTYTPGNLGIGRTAGSNGTLRVTSGRVDLQLAEATYLGSGAGAVGRLELLAGGTLSKPAGLLRVGVDGATGSINITNGTLLLESTQIGGDDTDLTTGGIGTVNLAGGLIIVTNPLAIGRDLDTGVVNVYGGAITNLNLDRTAQNLLTIAGPNGTGTLAIHGGIVHNETGVRMANGATANATLLLNGGTLITPRIFFPSSGFATVELNGGTLTAFSNNAVLIAASGSAFVTIKAGGAIIDTAGHNVSVDEELGTDGSGGGLTKKGAGRLTLTGTSFYSGNTILQAGELNVLTTALNGSGNLVISNGTTLTVRLPDGGNGSTLSVPSLTLGSGGATTLNLGMTNIANPATAPISVNGALTPNGPVTINITGTALTAGQFPLISYSSLGGSGFGAFVLGSLPTGVTANLVNGPNSINLNVTAALKTLAWSGAANNNWDTTSTNWVDLNAGSIPARYSQSGGLGDNVTFEDFSLVGSPNINLAGTVTPFSLNFNGFANTYSISGAGKISGAVSLIKANSSTLRLATANDYSGGTVLGGGVLQLGGDAALGAGTLTYTNGNLSSDSVAPRTLTNNIQVGGAMILGDAVNTGTLTLAGNMNLGNATRALTLNSDVVVAGSISNSVVDVGLDYVDGPGKLTVPASGVLDVGGLFEQANGGVVIDGGKFINHEGYRLYSPQPASTQLLLITNGGHFAMDHRVGALAGGGNIVVGTSAGISSPDATNLIEVADGTVIAITAGGGNGRILFSQNNSGIMSAMNIRAAGTVSCRRFEGQQGTSGRLSELNIYGGTVKPIADEGDFMLNLSSVFVHAGGITVDTENYTIGIAQPLLAGSGSGGLTKLGTGRLNLNGVNSYTGATLVNAGTLGGNGTISGSLTVNAAGNLAPGLSVGTLTVNGAMSLAGSVQAEVSVSGSITNNDLVIVGGNATYGGTLTIVNGGPDPLAVGMVFKLFNVAGTKAGNFASITVTPDLGLSGTFDPVTGEVTLTAGAAPNPVINSVSLSGGNLVLQGTNGAAAGSYSVLTTTNVALPLAAWVTNTTGTFTASGTFSNAIPVNPGEPQRFYLLKQP